MAYGRSWPPPNSPSSAEQLGLIGLGLIAVFFALPLLDGWTYQIVERMAAARYGVDAAQVFRWGWFCALGLTIYGVAKQGFKVGLSIALTSAAAKFIPM